MFPFGFALGAIAGATAVLVLGPEVTLRARPIAKAALKAALTAMHEARVRTAEMAEAAEDLYAEAKAEVTAEAFAAAMAAARAKATTESTAKPKKEAALADRPAAKAARRRAAVRRSRPIARDHG
jgi:gas vesicle protein